MSTRKDGQVVEIMGRNWLVNELFAAGIEVARPERDRGVDLIAYQDRAERFTAVPLQMKAYSKTGFDIEKKYARMPGLLIVYVWNLEDPAITSSVALTYPEALEILEAHPWATSKSWTEGGGYSVPGTTKRLLAMLEPYQMTHERWRARLAGTLGHGPHIPS